MKKAILYLSILLIYTGCVGGLGFAMKEKIIGNYYLIAVDDSEDCVLSYHELADGDLYGHLIESTVFAVGYNDKYMLVKQHPSTFPNPPDKKVTNYYILPLKKGMDWKNKNGLIGPLSLEQFITKHKELNIDNLIYTREIEYLK